MTYILGVDPGPRPGVVVLELAGGRVLAVHKVDWPALGGLVATAHLVALERFVLGRGTLRKTKAGTEETLAQVGEVRKLCEQAGTRLVEYPAGVVKPWATDARLREFGAYVTGDHYRDAARHALFSAVRSKLLPRRAYVDSGNNCG